MQKKDTYLCINLTPFFISLSLPFLPSRLSALLDLVQNRIQRVGRQLDHILNIRWLQTRYRARRAQHTTHRLDCRRIARLHLDRRSLEIAENATSQQLDQRRDLVLDRRHCLPDRNAQHIQKAEAVLEHAHALD